MAAKKGELQVRRPEIAAEELCGIWQGFSAYRLPMGIDQDELIADIPDRVRRGIKVFLKAYGPQKR